MTTRHIPLSGALTIAVMLTYWVSMRTGHAYWVIPLTGLPAALGLRLWQMQPKRSACGPAHLVALWATIGLTLPLGIHKAAMPHRFLQASWEWLWAYAMTLGLCLSLVVAMDLLVWTNPQGPPLGGVRRRTEHVALWVGVVTLLGLGHHMVTRMDVGVDLSVAKTLEPSPTLVRLVSTSPGPEVTVYLEPDDARLPLLRAYFLGLANLGVPLHVVDQAALPRLARAHQVLGNGHVVISGKERHLVVALHEEHPFRDLDGQLVRAWRVAVQGQVRWGLVQGHGELRWGGSVGQRERIEGMVALLRQEQGVEMVRLGRVSDRALAGLKAVILAGPKRAYEPEEVAQLLAFMDRGGSVWLGLEPLAPEAFLSLEPLLASLGVSMGTSLVCHDSSLLASHKTIKDREDLILADFGPHPVTDGLRKELLGVVVSGSGVLVDEPVTKPDLVTKRTDLLLSAPDAWLAPPGLACGERNPGTAGQFVIARAVEVSQRGEGSTHHVARHVVTADATIWSDFALSHSQGNEAFALALAAWLRQMDLPAEEPSRDRRVVHRLDEEQWWFWGMTLLPVVLLCGAALRRRRRQSTTQ